jgi:hypothetical protein
MLARVERHERLPADPWLELLPALSPPYWAAVASFPGHIVVAADVDRRWLDSWLGTHDDLHVPLSARFLGALEALLRLDAGSIDAVLLAPPATGEPALSLTPLAGDHPRLARAGRFRHDVRAWTCGPGVLVLGRGLGGRWEAAIEVNEQARNAGLGRSLAAAARHLVPDGRSVWAQVAPGNATSMRAFLAAGYRPVGAEVLLMPPIR